MKKVFLSLALIAALSVVSCKQTDNADATSTVDTVAVDTTSAKADSTQVDTTAAQADTTAVKAAK